jgi:uncharacterized Tic20 family protein
MSSGGVPAVPTSEEKTMAMLAHGGGIFFSFLPALVIYLTKGNESPYIREEAKEALNFQITVAIATVVSLVLVLVLVGILMLMAVGVGALVLMIMAVIAVNNGQPYRYPVNLRIIK